MSIESIRSWHERARPNPTAQDFDVQLGCHLEEVVEMFDTLEFYPADFPAINGARHHIRDALMYLSLALKAGHTRAHVKDRRGFLDAVADQVVTVVGAAHCAGMDPTRALWRVDQSNWSKFDENGHPIRDAHGKISKGPNYAPPVLDGLF